MTEKTIPAIQRPRVDDRPIWDIFSGIFGYPAVLVSHDLKLFSLLAEKPRTLSEVCDSLGIASRPAEALLTVNSSLGLVRVENDRYSLTPLAETYLVESSPVSFSGFLDLHIANYSLYSVESIKKLVLTNSPQLYGGEDYVKTHEEQAELACRYAPLELNGFPSWLESLAVEHPAAVDQVLGEELSQSLREVVDSNTYSMFLQNISHASAIVTALFVPRISAWLMEIAKDESKLNNPSLSRCVIDTMGGISFNPPRGGDIHVTFPIIFSTGF